MINICTTKLTKKGIITVSFPIHGNWDTLQTLKRSCALLNATIDEEKALPLTGKNSEISVLLYSIESVLRTKFSGNASDQMKSKCADVKCELHHNQFIITIDTIGSFGAIRKVLGITAKYIMPSSLTPFYKENCIQLHRKFNADECHYAQVEVATACKKIAVTITGPMNLTSDHIKVLESVWKDNFNGDTVPKGGKGIATAADEHKQHQASIKTNNGFETYMIKSYLQTFNHGSMIHNDGLLVKTFDNKLKDNERIKKFIETKYMKHDDKLHDVLSICCAIEGCMDASELSKIPKKMDQSKLVDAIKKNLP